MSAAQTEQVEEAEAMLSRALRDAGSHWMTLLARFNQYALGLEDFYTTLSHIFVLCEDKEVILHARADDLLKSIRLLASSKAPKGVTLWHCFHINKLQKPISDADVARIRTKWRRKLFNWGKVVDVTVTLGASPSLALKKHVGHGEQPGVNIFQSGSVVQTVQNFNAGSTNDCCICYSGVEVGEEIRKRPSTSAWAD